MRLSRLLSAAAICASSWVAFGQAATQASWVGVWNGTLDGQPAVTLTLADDHGRLGGTVVFNIVMKQPHPHIQGTDPVMVMQPELKGDTLSFHVIRSRDQKELEILLKRVDARHVTLQCLDCGGGPMATLVKFGE